MYAITEALAANGVTADDTQLALLARFADTLLAWNKDVNLISRASADDFAVQHIADSALAARMLPPCATLVDLGSGGGLPGMVIAILRPEIRVTLSETKEKKIKYLQACARGLNLQNLLVLDAAHDTPERIHEILVCRAFAALDKIARESKKYLVPGGKMYAFKGRRSSVELELGVLPKNLRWELVPYNLVNTRGGQPSERTLVIIET
jgi:16S rRNA (guanine527-N7)-methyltransferase